MTQLYTGKDSDWEKHVFPCDCGDGDYLRIWWEDLDDDDNPQWRYLGIESGRHVKSWSKRLSAIWRLLRGKPIYADDIILNVGVATELRDFLDAKLDPDHEAHQAVREVVAAMRAAAARGAEDWDEIIPDPVVTAALEEIDQAP